MSTSDRVSTQQGTNEINLLTGKQTEDAARNKRIRRDRDRAQDEATQDTAKSGSWVNRRRGSAQRQAGATRQPTFRTAQSVQTLVSPIDPVIFIATSPNHPVAATCFPDECGRIPGHPDHSSAHFDIWPLLPRRASRSLHLRPRTPCLARPPSALRCSCCSGRDT